MAYHKIIGFISEQSVVQELMVKHQRAYKSDGPKRKKEIPKITQEIGDALMTRCSYRLAEQVYSLGGHTDLAVVARSSKG